MKITGNEPAMPHTTTSVEFADVNSEKQYSHVYSEGGLTIRQQFSAQFYAARLTGLAMNTASYSRSQLAVLSVEDADVLIAELNKATE